MKTSNQKDKPSQIFEAEEAIYSLQDLPEWTTISQEFSTNYKMKHVFLFWTIYASYEEEITYTKGHVSINNDQSPRRAALHQNTILEIRT